MSHLSPLAFAGPSAPKPPDHPPMQVLRRAGLRVDEERFVLEAWERMDGAQRTEWYEAVSTDLDADELRRQIEELRSTGWSESVADGVSDDTPAVQDAVDAAPEDPGPVPDGTVEVVLEWVGDDPDRAAAALAAEAQRHDPPRKTLVEPLEDIAGA